MDKAQIISKVQQAGVVGAGGAGFPTHVKLDAQVERVLANGASCEPLLMSDPYLMEAMPERLLQGLRLVMAATGAGEGLVCLKGKHHHAMTSLRQALSSDGDGLGVFELEDFYPAGDEQVLVYEVTRRVVPEGGIPLMVGAVVSNVESLINIAEAMEGRPVTHRYLTVCGEVAQPMVTRVPIGISLQEVIDLAGGPTISDFRVLVGGPMMGAVAADPAAPVTKTTERGDPAARGPQRGGGQEKGPGAGAQRGPGGLLPVLALQRPLPAQPAGPRPVPPQDHAPAGRAGRAQPGAAGGRPDLQRVRHMRKVRLSHAAGSSGDKRGHQAGSSWPRASGGDRPRAQYRPSLFREYRKVPTSRLMERLQVARYDVHPPFVEYQGSPSQVRIPLKQHLGAPAQATVSPGDRVSAGQVIGEIPEGALGARVHASVAGTVQSVDDAVLIAASKEV